MSSRLFIGLMSGTSLDGVDGVLARLHDDGKMHVEGHAFRPFAHPFRDTLLALNQSGPNELHLAALAGNQVSRHYAQVVHDLLAHATLRPQDITAIGAHGQTVRHRPLEFDGDSTSQQAAVGYTIQLINAALLTELTDIDVVADFRNRDLAAGGQGAPLVPAFHQGVFGLPGQCVAAMNIGGISNISVLHADGSVQGWDCGPGNALMDFWCQQHTGQAFDRDGAWAATGTVHADLLHSLLSEDFLSRVPPKSTGRDLFSLSWLDRQLAPFATERPQDIQNTLTEFTARVCAENVRLHAATSTTLIVCGGGAFNRHLMQRLQDLLPDVQVTSSGQYGLAPLQVEAAAFAWLARQTMLRRPGNLPSVTGAAGLRVLGAIYPA